MDPELAIVAIVLVFLVVALALAWRGRQAVIARRAEMERSTSVEVPVVSQGRAAAVLVPMLLIPPALFLGTMIALDATRAHALLAVGGAMVLAMVGIVVGSFVTPTLARVGALRLVADRLTLASGASSTDLELRGDFELREAVVLPDRYANGGRVETVVRVARGGSEIVFRYPCLAGESPLAPEGALAPPFQGTAVDASARVLHERLRKLATR